MISTIDARSASAPSPSVTVTSMESPFLTPSARTERSDAALTALSPGRPIVTASGFAAAAAFTRIDAGRA